MDQEGRFAGNPMHLVDGIDDLPMEAGVYCILNRMTGHRYVGCSAGNMRARGLTHRSELRRGKPSNFLMRAHLAQHGPGAFFFFALQVCPNNGDRLSRFRLDRTELWWTIQLLADDERYGYNSVAGQLRTSGARFRERERRLIRTCDYEYLPGVDRSDRVSKLVLDSWIR